MANQSDTLELFQGTDHGFELTVLDASQSAVVDISTWALSWMVKRRKSDADADAVLTKTTAAGIVISGAFNADPDLNTQIATASVEDSNTTSVSPGVYHHEWKRTDVGLEAVLSFGLLSIKQGVHR